MMTGLPYLVRMFGGIRRPRQATPGMDVCGEIVQVGSDVRDLRVGQRVFGIARGSFAEYAVDKSRHLAQAPDELTDSEAAVLAESGLTAPQALDSAGLRSIQIRGLRMLIIGASGGVGSLAVALASRQSTEVTGVCSAGKAQFVIGLGATNVIDYHSHDPLDGTERYDVILDAAGGRWGRGYGRPFAYQMRMLFSQQRFVNLLVVTKAVDLERLAQHVRSDSLRPPTHATFPLTNTREALDELVSGRTAGKIVIITITEQNQEHLA